MSRDPISRLGQLDKMRTDKSLAQTGNSPKGLNLFSREKLHAQQLDATHFKNVAELRKLNMKNAFEKPESVIYTKEVLLIRKNYQLL